MKLAKVTRGECKMVPSTIDGELCMLHEDVSPSGGVACAARRPTGERWRKLLALMAKHVDDLKLCGTKETIM